MTAQTILPANSVTGGYDVENSLRFNDDSSDYLSSHRTHLRRRLQPGAERRSGGEKQHRREDLGTDEVQTGVRQVDVLGICILLLHVEECER